MKERPTTHNHVILPSKESSAPQSKFSGRNAYWVSGIVFCVVFAAGGIALTLPRVASAFWPFAVSQAATSPAPILNDASLELMEAPLSSDPATTTDDTPITTPDGSALLPTDVTDASSSVSQNTPDQVTAPSNGTISEYTVKPGDNLSTIAQNFGISVNTILWANDITDPSSIHAGTKLVILPVSGIQHTVRSGETLSSIAAKYGGDAADIAQFNGISSETALKAGMTIIIPDGELTPAEENSAPSTGSSAAKKVTSTESSGTAESTPPTHSSSGTVECADTSDNPCHGIDGTPLPGFFTNPLPSARVSQGLHGWDAVDLAAPSGTPIMAAANGTVILSRMGGWNGGYGNYVILDNGSGVETLYAHMSETKATVGDTVSAGEVIGYVGMTGDATGDHLHFEVRGARNPFAFCSGSEESDDSCFDN